MIPAGYLAKRVRKKPDWLNAEQVLDIYSISGCVSADFADYIDYWKHNGHWLFDSPETVRDIASKEDADLTETRLFYYEVFEQEFDGRIWRAYGPLSSLPTSVVVPSEKTLEGFDIATFSRGNMAEHSPLSCNHLAAEFTANSHCLLDSFEEAKRRVGNGEFNESEPGPYRIFAVYSVPWS